MEQNARIAEFVVYLQAAGRSKGTIDLRLSYLRRLQRQQGPLLTLTKAHLLPFLANPRWSPETRRAARSSLRLFYGWAYSEGHIATDPAAGLPKVRVPVSVPRPAPDVVMTAAVAEAGPRAALMLMLAMSAGLRRDEIARVHSRDISADMLHVRGKGGMSRLVPLVPDLARALAARPEGWVFPGQIDGHLSAAWVGRLMSRHLAAHWTAHTLRHAAATRWLARCGNTRIVQVLLGHASLITTQRYTAVPDAAVRAVVLFET